jgi:hypothetical protein
MRLPILAALIITLLSGSSAWAETYVVPVWARALEGSDGVWSAQALAVNPNDFPVSLQVTRVFPLRTTGCSTCAAESAPLTIAPRASAVVNPPAGQAGRALVAGAFEVNTSGPVHLHLVAYRPAENELRQRLDVARAWLLPGTRAISSVERGGAGWRMNVFVVNPNPVPLNVAVWSGNRAENEVRTTIAAGTTAVVALPLPRCGGAPCPIGDIFPPPPLQAFVEADGVFLASVSSLGSTWAVFSLADEAFIAR